MAFAPLSPTSTRRLDKIHKDAESNPDTIHNHVHVNPEPELEPLQRQTSHKRRRRTRRNSDPSSDRPHTSSKHQRRRHRSRSPKASRSRDASPPPNSSDSSDVEILPDRFDQDGRPLDRFGNRFAGSSSSGGGLRDLIGDRGGGGRQSEMVEKIVRDVGDVVEGKKTWKDLLIGVVSAAQGSEESFERGGGSEDEGGRRRRRRRHRTE